MHLKALLVAFVLALFCSAVPMSQLVGLASANPYQPPPFYPETPNEDPPIITVQSPNNITYYVNEVPLNFSVTKRDSWTQNNLTTVNIKKIVYQLDGQVVILWPVIMNRYSPLPTTSQFSEILNVSEGQHVLQINVTATSFYDPKQSVDWHFTSVIWLVTSETVVFNVESDNKIPEFPSWTPLLIMLLSVTMIAITYRRRICKPAQGTE